MASRPIKLTDTEAYSMSDEDFEAVVFEEASEHFQALGDEPFVLRQLPNYGRRPIVVLTAETGADMKNKGLAAGAPGWMAKPLDPPKLLEVAAKVLGQ